MKTLDLNQLTVESFDVGTPDASTQGSLNAPIVSTDEVPHCGANTVEC
jgi:hypothetical protein